MGSLKAADASSTPLHLTSAGGASGDRLVARPRGLGSTKDQPAGSNGSAKTVGLDSDAGRPTAWWRSFVLCLASGIAWVISIPILLTSLAGSLQPHVGWLSGFITAVAMFSVLVQVDQRVAAFVVCLVTTGSTALVAWNGHGGVPMPLCFGLLASGMTLLNGISHPCSSCPSLFDFQCQHYAGYFKRCELRGDLDSIRPTGSFFACHPHGILSMGWISNVLWSHRFHKAAGRCYFLIDGTLRNKGLLARPFCDAFEGDHGSIRDSSKATLQSLMRRKESISMIPGAYQEATLCSFGKDRVALSKRKGFVKYCLSHGYRLHPVYTFGESETYRTLRGFEKLRLWLNDFGIPTVAFWGLTWCPVLPRWDVELMTFVGPPLELPMIPEPTPEQVTEWHGRYMDALRVLFDKCKAEAGRPNAELEIV